MVQASPAGPWHSGGRPGRRFTRRHRQLRVGLSQLLFVIAGLVLGIFVPKISAPPTVSSGRIVDLLFTAGVTVISLITVIYSLLFLVVQWVSSTFSLRLTLFRDDPIVWRAFAYSIGIFVFCFTAAFSIGNRKDRLGRGTGTGAASSARGSDLHARPADESPYLNAARAQPGRDH